MSMNRIYLLIAFSCLIIFNLSAQPAPKHEVRAAWITAVYGLDWPRTKATTPAGSMVANSRRAPQAVTLTVGKSGR